MGAHHSQINGINGLSLTTRSQTVRLTVQAVAPRLLVLSRSYSRSSFAAIGPPKSLVRIARRQLARTSGGLTRGIVALNLCGTALTMIICANVLISTSHG